MEDANPKQTPIKRLSVPPSAKEFPSPDLLDLEQAIIGGLLVDPDSWDRISDIVTSQDFENQKNREIFQIIADLIDKNETPDIVAVSDRLKSSTQREQHKKGILAYLFRLFQEVPSSANIASYASILRSHALRKNLMQAAGQIIEEVHRKPNEDVDILVDAAERRIFAIGDDRKKSEFAAIGDLGKELFSLISKRSESDSSITGLPSGYHQFDENTSGLQAGDLVVIAGRPGMGKTSFAMNIVENIALRKKRPCAIFSLEMPASQITMRICASVARINQMHMKTGKLTDEEWAKLSRSIRTIADAPIYIDDSSVLTPTEIRSRVRRLKREHKDLGVVIVDYLQLMNGQSQTENRATEISQISRSLKGLAKEMDLTVIALSQLNRQIESRKSNKPQLSDLRESGAIEQDADLVAVIYEGEEPEEGSQNVRVLNVGVVKQRNGPTFTMKMTFLGSITRFENYVPDEVIASTPEVRTIGAFYEMDGLE